MVFRRFYSFRSILLVLSCLLICTLAGCSVFGVFASALPQYVNPVYEDLKNQNVSVMVWADRGVRMDYPNILIDTTAVIQAKMEKLQKEEKPKELEGVTWPNKAASVVRFQRDHPELELTSATEIAPRLNVTRLIYVEINGFATRSEQAMQLYRGTLTANLRVIAVSKGKGKVVYEENDIKALYPKDSPKEGLLNGNDYTMYLGTLDRFSTVIVQKFVKHEKEK